jgi:hypothetical protein
MLNSRRKPARRKEIEMFEKSLQQLVDSIKPYESQRGLHYLLTYVDHQIIGAALSGRKKVKMAIEIDKIDERQFKFKVNGKKLRPCFMDCPIDVVCQILECHLSAEEFRQGDLRLEGEVIQLCLTLG